jgi:tetratricopeptide (TPR) repeat protein
MSVKAWQENVVIPTYGIGVPEKNPVYLEKRVYQGSSGVVYPHPVIEKILDEKGDKQYAACFLENEYLKIMILPELGGRVQSAYDKIKQRYFIYQQDVIKPALVGLTGPWISGGIEFNWPQHHRPSTFDPVDVLVEQNDDGSATVWCSEVERMFRTKGMAGFTLYPGVAYLEIKVKLFNRTTLPQTFLWWANPAVHVNDHYQSVFPPDVHAVYDHGRRDVSEFPIARGTYYKVDYSAGVDISRYKNIPVPTSYMAVSSRYDFLGGYEHDTGGGLLHVADHHISPGKKQWTWGNGDFGRAWDRNLTDNGGPYIELMCGVFTDNQPDFSWLMPGEERSFEQYFMPYRDLGVIKNATRDAALNLEVRDGKADVKIGVTRRFAGAVVELQDGGELIFRETVDLVPERSYLKMIDRRKDGSPENLLLRILDAGGNQILAWRPHGTEAHGIPEPARPARLPAEIAENEQLYLTGLHLEQYRHANYDPAAYYREAIRRDPGDSRCNNALGLLHLRHGQPAKAEPFFRKAIETLTARNANPYDGEPSYNLGLALSMQGKLHEGFDSFAKAAWNAPVQDASLFCLAQIASRKGEYAKALELAEKALVRNWHHHRCRHLITALLRKVGKKERAATLAAESLALDHFNLGCLFEEALLAGDRGEADQESARRRVLSNSRGNVHTHIEFSVDYAAAGFYEEASALLSLLTHEGRTDYPMLHYFLGYFASLGGNPSAARDHYRIGADARPDYCFPNRWEEIFALLDAQRVNPQDAKAPYYLGNLWYGFRQYDDAVECWEKSVALDERFPTAWRNLALAYYNKRNKGGKALDAMEKAFALDPSDARVLMELDQLYRKLGRTPAERLSFLEKHPRLVDDRDDLYLEKMTLLNLLGRHEEARALIVKRKFHPWEGGEGKVTGQYVQAHLGLAKAALAGKRFGDALELLKKTEVYPENLGEGKLPGALENDLLYYRGCACEGRGDADGAKVCFLRASVGLKEPAQAYFYNDQSPDTIFYQGLALRKLGRESEAGGRFKTLVEFAERHLNDRVTLDYFAVSLPDLLIWEDDLTRRNRLHCQYLKALGLLGLGRNEEAVGLLESVIEADPSHPGAVAHLGWREEAIDDEGLTMDK